VHCCAKNGIVALWLFTENNGEKEIHEKEKTLTPGALTFI
jgi:hypothetical protein